MKYAVMIMFDTDCDYNYVPESWPCNTNESYKPKLFNTYEAAEKECSKWNTGIIVDYTDDILRPMTQKERQRAEERQLANTV
jgi:hypothetical protein